VEAYFTADDGVKKIMGEFRFNQVEGDAPLKPTGDWYISNCGSLYVETGYTVWRWGVAVKKTKYIHEWDIFEVNGCTMRVLL